MHVLQLVRKRRRWDVGHHYGVTSHDAGEVRRGREEGRGTKGEREREKQKYQDYLHT